MFERAKWIKHRDVHTKSLMLRKEFTIADEVKSAVMCIIGLGYGIYTVNGREVTDEVLTTQFTVFDKRILYNKYDVTKLLNPGENCIGVVLGNGNYNIHEKNIWNFDTASWHDNVKVIGQIEIIYESGKTETVVTDSSWKTCVDGPIVYNIPRGGEIYDARKEMTGWNLSGFSDENWINARIARSPGGILEENVYLNPKIIREIKPISKNEKNVYDFGENTTGWVKISVSGEEGSEVHLHYGERLYDDGRLNNEGINKFNLEDGLKHEEVYILKGVGTEEHHPVFNFHGFRYVYLEIKGKINNIELTAQVVYTDLKTVGSFECSDKMLNRIHEASVRSTLTNMLSVPMDCPHREQNGWTGDAYFSAQQSIMNFDMKLFYEKWLGDIRDSQRPSGQIPSIVPSPNCWGYFANGGPVWDSALTLIPLQYYEYTGDKTLLEQNIEAIKRDVNYFETLTDDYLCSEGIGDWVPPGRKPIWPPVATVTAFFYLNAKSTAKSCEILGQDGSYYEELSEKIKRAYREKFIKTGIIGTEGQLDYAIAIYCGLLEPDEEVKAAERLNRLVVEKNYHIDTGTTGVKAIFTALAKYGYDTTLYKMVTNPTYPSYAYWINNGATTLCESWKMNSSLNHHMFSEVDHWLYRYLAGIQLSENGTTIEPHFVGLDYVKATCRDVSVDFNKERIKIKSGRSFKLKLGEIVREYQKGEYSVKL